MRYFSILTLLLSFNLSLNFDLYDVDKIQNIMDEIVDIFDKKHANCANDLNLLVTSTVKMERWAIRMFDSWSKIQSGYFHGNIFGIGNYEQCLNIYRNHSNHLIKGQYCTLTFYPNNDKNLISDFVNISKLLKFVEIETTEPIYRILKSYKVIYGICLPHSCTPDSLNDFWQLIQTKLKIKSFEIVAYDTLCDFNGKPILPFPIDFWVFVFFITVIIIIVLSTIYDLLTQNKVFRNDYLVAFSIYTNLRRLFSTKTDDKRTLTCLYGLKTISILWIILGHRFLANIFTPSTNGLYTLTWLNSMQVVLVILGQLSVDTFLTISGILLIYTKLIVGETGKLSIIALYVYRLIRLLPALIATIAFYISVIKYLGDGPGWRTLINKITNSCYNTWWITLFQFTNFLNIEHQCIEQSWYLSIDSQLYFLSPIILFNIEKYRKRTFLGIISILLSSIIYTFYITIKYNYGSSILDLNRGYLNYLYYPTLVRMPPWLIGIIAGYFIYNNRKNNFKLSKLMNLILWLIFCCLFTCIIVYHVMLVKSKITPFYSAIFNAFGKVVWSILISWIIFACSTNPGGVINRFLSLPIFTILSKLSYSMFLIHLGVLFVLVGNRQIHQHFSCLSSYHDFFGDVVLTIICSIIWCLCFESPSLNLIKIYQKQRSGLHRVNRSLNLYRKDTTE